MFKERSFFTELLKSFTLLLCVPIITIMLLLMQSNRIVKDQVLDVENTNLHLYVEQMEDMMEDMENICHTLYSSEYCKLYASEVTNNSLLAYDLRTKVTNTLKSVDKTSYYDVFIYYSNDDRVISSKRSSLNAANYYATYYSNLKADPDLQAEFLDILQPDYKKPMCHIINDGSNNPYLCMTMVRKFGNSQSNYTVCVVVEPSYLQQLLVMQNKNADSIFIVYNTDQQLLFSNNAVLEKQYIAELVSLNDAEADSWLDNSEYMIQIKHSAVLDNYYVYAVSKDYFWSTLSTLRMWGLIGAGTCVIISLFLAYRSAVRTYRPVNSIMEFLKQKKEDTLLEAGKSEFLHIMSFMEAQERVLKENKQISREWFLHGLLEGKGKYVDVQSLEKNNISFQGEKFAVCIIYADVLEAELEDLCRFVVQNVLEELCRSVGKAYFVGFSKNRYALLINLFGEEYKLSEVLQEGLDYLKQQLQLILSIGCSSIYVGLDAIPEAYREAQEAIRYRFLLGNGRLIGYEDIRFRSMSYRNEGESKVYMLLLDYIEHKKEEDNQDDFVEQLMYVYQMNEEMSVDVALMFKHEIVAALGKIMELCGYDEESNRKARKNLKNTATLSEFQQLLSGQIAELCKCNIKRKPSVDVLEKTKQYIDEHYSDTELSLTTIGNAVGMQGNHLSRIFKERYGIAMLDYVTGVRISQAKRLIQENGCSVQEAAEKTGFLSSTVFIRTFKKKEGITPGKYKEMVEKERYEKKND